jgi:hypothetical protein
MYFPATCSVSFESGQGPVRPGPTCSAPASWCARRGSGRHPMAACAAGDDRIWRWPTGTTAATSPPRCTGGTGVGRAGGPAGHGGVMCPSWPATREEKDTTRGRAAGAAGDARARAGRCGTGARPEVHDGPGPVPVVQGLLARLPDRRGHGLLQGRGAAPELPPAAAPAVALHAGLAAPLGRRRRPAPRLANAVTGSRWAAGSPSGAPVSTSAARCRRSPRAPSGRRGDAAEPGPTAMGRVGE